MTNQTLQDNISVTVEPVRVEICMSDTKDTVIQCLEQQVISVMDSPAPYIGHRGACREGRVRYEQPTNLPFIMSVNAFSLRLIRCNSHRLRYFLDS